MAEPRRNLIARILTTTGAAFTLASEVAWQPDHPIAPPPPLIEKWDGEWTPSDFDTDNHEADHIPTSRFAVWHPIAQAWWEITPYVASWHEDTSTMVYPNREGIVIEIRIHNELGIQELFNLQEASALGAKYVMRKDDNIFQAKVRVGFEGNNDGMTWIIDVIERQDRVTNDMLVLQEGHSNARPSRLLNY